MQLSKIMTSTHVFVCVTDNLKWYKKAMYWICGVEGLTAQKSHKPQAVIEMSMDIHENPCQSTLVNIAAMVLMVGTAFVWGYYA